MRLLVFGSYIRNEVGMPFRWSMYQPPEQHSGVSRTWVKKHHHYQLPGKARGFYQLNDGAIHMVI
jgi:hypothetical protein